jgi:outer membrane receptor protein involved in Fe transport
MWARCRESGALDNKTGEVAVNYRHKLLCSMLTTVAAVALHGAALAQGAETSAPTDTATGANDLLGEVVVTATRQVDTVNKVALSVSAVSQATINAQGIKSVDDLSRTVPGLTFRRTGGEGNPNVTIRGIGGNGATVGSQTTGVYLDDTALQRRNVNGLVTGNGSPFPLLYDLERVEVLRGPQGTLYGGSSQGGTVRFITPAPSLTDYSGTARAEVSKTKGGGTSFEYGGAYGGPIVEDKLGFRISGLYRFTAGYIDALSKYDGHLFQKDFNYNRAYAGRGALLWQITPRAKATLALYMSHEYSNDNDTIWKSVPAANFTGGLVRNGSTSNANGPICTMTQASLTGTCRTSGGVYFAFPDTTIAPFSNNAQPWYDQHGYASGNGRYLSTTNVVYQGSPRKTDLALPSLTLEYDFGSFTAKSITSYVNDRTSGIRYNGGGYAGRVTPRILFGTQPCSPFNNPLGTATNCYTFPDYLPGIPDTFSYYYYYNRRNAITEELRFTSNPSDSPLSWVAGLYFNSSRIHVHGAEHNNENYTSLVVRGVPEAWFIGNYPLPGERNAANAVGSINTWPINVSDREINLDETELAAFGEANYNLTEKLKVTAGARVTRYKQDFYQQYGGAVAGIPLAGTSYVNPQGFIPSVPGNSAANPVRDPYDLRPFALNLAGCPSARDCPLQYTLLNLKEKPFTPKLGLAYQFDQQNMVYANMSKGFRAGGVNPAVPPAQCATDLAALGITAVPETFKGDTVTSYEAGAKVRLFNRIQLNSSAFLIDWKDVQFNFGLRCGFAFVANAATARSKGAEVQAAGRFGPLTLNANIGYNKATFSKDVKNPSSGALLQAKGDNLGVPDWTIALGAQYDTRLLDAFDFYWRVDYQYQGKYMRNPSAPVSTYDPLTHSGQAIDVWNTRAGVFVGKADISLFVQNVTNSRDDQNLTHAQDSLRLTTTTFRPRTAGVQVNYRF